MSAATDNTDPQRYTYHLDHCTACEKHDRAKAYRWLGENHWIPGLHGANWLGQDLIREIGKLDLGLELEFDYRGETRGAPRLIVRRSTEGVITAGARDDRTSWIWEPNDGKDRTMEITMELLAFLRSRRGAQQVILIGPES